MRSLIMYSHGYPSDRHLQTLTDLFGVEPLVARDESSAVDMASEAEIILGHRYFNQAFPYAERVRWVQSTAAGIDLMICPSLLERRPLLTRCPIFGEDIARHGWIVAQSLIRRLPLLCDRQRSGMYDIYDDFLPWPKRALVIGLGRIGQALTRLLQANELTVWGVDLISPSDYPPNVLLPLSDWRGCLPEMDLVFLALPMTPMTRNFLDAEAIASLPSHCVVLNLGRELLWDTAAIVTALDEKRLGGAYLDFVPQSDVIDKKTDNFLITPKVSPRSPERIPKIEQFIEAQAQTYVRGEIPFFPVDLEVYL